MTRGNGAFDTMSVRSKVLTLASAFSRDEIAVELLLDFLDEHAQELSSLPEGDPAAQLAGALESLAAELDDGMATVDDLRGRVLRFFHDQGHLVTVSTGSENRDSPHGNVHLVSTDESPPIVERIQA
jgi:hypothetical protein